ncbi:MAG TPA: hypothetical protein VII95_20615 [Terriglobales bacterium]
MTISPLPVEPGKIRLTNGPIRTVTQPIIQKSAGGDGQVVEFLIPVPTLILDSLPWKPVKCMVGGLPSFVEKPLSSMLPSYPDARIGNESADAYCTILRVGTPEGLTERYPTPADLWPTIVSLLSWMRVKARHYWMMHGQSPFGLDYRGSILNQRGNQTGLQNFSTYGRSVIVRPLTEGIWYSLEAEMCSGADIPVSEALFCDALVSAVTGAELKSVLELGVAAEVAITQLLSDVAGTPPTNPEKRKFLAKGEWDSFKEKMEKWPSKLGLQSAKSFKIEAASKDWTEHVKELYRYRGSVAHSGRIRLTKNIAVYIHATNALLHYCREQRRRADLNTYSFPAGNSPFHQIEAVSDGVISCTSETVYGERLGTVNASLTE